MRVSRPRIFFALRMLVTTVLATSAIHRQFKFNKAKSEIIKLAIAGVKQAKKFVDDVQFSPEDASRTEPDFLAEVVTAVIEAGGMRAVDAGSLKRAHELEALGFLQLSLAAGNKTSWTSGFALAK